MRFLIFCLIVLIPACPANAQSIVTPMPTAKIHACNDEYMKGAKAYWPIVGDILRFNAMFQKLCRFMRKGGPTAMEGD